MNMNAVIDYHTLPNAEIISKVLDSYKLNTEIWQSTKRARTQSPIELHTIFNEAWNKAFNVERISSSDHLNLCISTQITGSVRDVILGLIAYPESNHLLHSDLNDVKLLTRLGNSAAILLYPGTVAFDRIAKFNLD